MAPIMGSKGIAQVSSGSDARLVEIDVLYKAELQVARSGWETATEQTSKAAQVVAAAAAEDLPFRRADRPSELSWHYPPPGWRKPDLEASRLRFMRIIEATSDHRRYADGEAEARHRYTQLLATYAVSQLLWTHVRDHQEALTTAWRKLVRTTAFGKLDTSRFGPVWQEFLADVLNPSVSHMCDEHGDAAEDGVRVAVATERDPIFTYLATSAAAGEAEPISEETLTPWEYERLCARLLADAGWNAETTSGSGDQGVDVLATRGGIRLVLQCKLYSKPVGNKAVQEAVAARGHERAQASAVVSNASYTRAAEDLALTNGVALLHHSELGSVDEVDSQII
jgi:hypothetical protein